MNIKNVLKKKREKENQDLVKCTLARNMQIQEKYKIRIFFVASFVAVCLLCICTYMVIDMIAIGTNAAAESFGTVKKQTAQEVYDAFYGKSYEVAEREHHVSNVVSISIGQLRETQNLEVLKVSEVVYEISAPEKKNGLAGLLESITGIFSKDITSLWEVPGSGVYTINLQIGEFVVDEERQYVLIRVPNPELTQITIDYTNVEVSQFEKGGIFKNSVKAGIDEAKEQLHDAELKLIAIAREQKYYQSARDAAKNMLVNLVKQLNPQSPNITVEVEFFDSFAE